MKGKKRIKERVPRSVEGLKTRRAILELLKVQPSDAIGLAAQLKVTGMAARLHLYQLLEERLVTFTETAQPLGRPKKIWSLTKEAAKFFPDAHATLTLNILDNIKEVFGAKGIGQLLEARTTQQLTAYQERLSATDSLKEKLHILAKLRTEEGYMAEVLDGATADLFIFLEHHCPICAAATHCRGLCDAELNVFQALVAGQASVARIDHILAGANRCAYEFRRSDPDVQGTSKED